jgi:hypothetical protein
MSHDLRLERVDDAAPEVVFDVLVATVLRRASAGDEPQPQA